MRLLDLDAKLYRLDIRVERFAQIVNGVAAEVVGPREYYVPAIELGTAHGVMFLCPRCRGGNDHRIMCWFCDRGVPDDVKPGPGRWTPVGTGLHDVSFVPGRCSPKCSVQLNGGCNAHFYVTNGDVIVA